MFAAHRSAWLSVFEVWARNTGGCDLLAGRPSAARLSFCYNRPLPSVGVSVGTEGGSASEKAALPKSSKEPASD